MHQSELVEPSKQLNCGVAISVASARRSSWWRRPGRLHPDYDYWLLKWSKVANPGAENARREWDGLFDIV